MRVNISEHLENPVLVKELRTRMRGARAYWIMGVYVCLLVANFWISYAGWRTTGPYTYEKLDEFGRILFTSLTIMQIVLCVFLAPALTSGAITIEREQRTFDFLLLTMLKPRQIFFGKIFSALSYLVLLLLSSLPLMGMGFMFGGTSPRELLEAFFIILGCAFFFGVVGMACSCFFARTASATAVAYGITLAFTAATFFVDLILFETVRWTRFMWGGPTNCTAVHPVFMSVNPVAAVVSALQPNDVHYHIFGTAFTVPIYPVTLFFYLLLGILLSKLAIVRIKPTE